TYVDQSQLLWWHAQMDEREILANDEVFAIAHPPAQGFQRRGPVIFTTPGFDVFRFAYRVIPELVNAFQKGPGLRFFRKAIKRREPLVQTPTTILTELPFRILGDGLALKLQGQYTRRRNQQCGCEQ